MSAEKILVIKLSAFGDFILALGPMAAIRRHHGDAHITLLTTAPFVSPARENGYFDDICVDLRPGLADVRGWSRLCTLFRRGGYDRVYDLQNNDRTRLYARLSHVCGGKKPPQWAGTMAGATWRDTVSSKKTDPVLLRHTRLLGLVGIEGVTYDPMEWVRGDATRFGLPHPYVLIVPGCAPTHIEKRWPAEHYAVLAKQLYAAGYHPVIIGTEREKNLAATIHQSCPEAVDLCGRTSMMDLVALARGAAGAVGNDTGPMHLIAPTGCPALVLFSAQSNPAIHAPNGLRVRCIQRNDLKALSPEHAAAEIFKDFLRHRPAQKEATRSGD